MTEYQDNKYLVHEGAGLERGDIQPLDTINKLEASWKDAKKAFKELFLGVASVLPSSCRSKMTQSRDREQNTPLSPVSRHESMAAAIHTLTPEPANLTLLLLRGVKMPSRFIETIIFFC